MFKIGLMAIPAVPTFPRNRLNVVGTEAGCDCPCPLHVKTLIILHSLFTNTAAISSVVFFELHGEAQFATAKCRWMEENGDRLEVGATAIWITSLCRLFCISWQVACATPVGKYNHVWECQDRGLYSTSVRLILFKKEKNWYCHP